MVGSVPALGGWNPANAVKLSSSGYPVWKTDVSVPGNSTIAYKYIKKDASGTVTWESGSNRAHTTGSGAGYAVSDTWK
ncbi:carbohydrate-binding module family 20 domain-containing protein [Streptomyces sp. NPDC006465]|uniref:carbohydrate-binding module family 20 domain-containing protein n=1 Tax=Streptomyces sp. NPDC006465 TaxID=3157174 RepID=UPI0033B5A41B